MLFHVKAPQRPMNDGPRRPFTFAVFLSSSYESVSHPRVIRLDGIASRHACLSVSRILDSHESALLCRLIHIPTLLLLNGPHPSTQYRSLTSLNCTGEMGLCLC